MKNAIVFGCLGFATNDAFIFKNGRQFMVGTVVNMLGDGRFEYWPYDFFTEHYIARKGEEYGLTEEDIPKPEDVIADYKRQYAEQGVVINHEIKYAG